MNNELFLREPKMVYIVNRVGEDRVLKFAFNNKYDAITCANRLGTMCPDEHVFIEKLVLRMKYG